MAADKDISLTGPGDEALNFTAGLQDKGLVAGLTKINDAVQQTVDLFASVNKDLKTQIAGISGSFGKLKEAASGMFESNASANTLKMKKALGADALEKVNAQYKKSVIDFEAFAKKHKISMLAADKALRPLVDKQETAQIEAEYKKITDAENKLQKQFAWRQKITKLKEGGFGGAVKSAGSAALGWATSGGPSKLSGAMQSIGDLPTADTVVGLAGGMAAKRAADWDDALTKSSRGMAMNREEFRKFSTEMNATANETGTLTVDMEHLVDATTHMDRMPASVKGMATAMDSYVHGVGLSTEQSVEMISMNERFFNMTDAGLKENQQSWQTIAETTTLTTSEMMELAEATKIQVAMGQQQGQNANKLQQDYAGLAEYYKSMGKTTAEMLADERGLMDLTSKKTLMMNALAGTNAVQRSNDAFFGLNQDKEKGYKQTEELKLAKQAMQVKAEHGDVAGQAKRYGLTVEDYQSQVLEGNRLQKILDDHKGQGTKEEILTNFDKTKRGETDKAVKDKAAAPGMLDDKKSSIDNITIAIDNVGKAQIAAMTDTIHALGDLAGSKGAKWATDALFGLGTMVSGIMPYLSAAMVGLQMFGGSLGSLLKLIPGLGGGGGAAAAAEGVGGAAATGVGLGIAAAAGVGLAGGIVANRSIKYTADVMDEKSKGVEADSLLHTNEAVQARRLKRAGVTGIGQTVTAAQLHEINARRMAAGTAPTPVEVAGTSGGKSVFDNPKAAKYKDMIYKVAKETGQDPEELGAQIMQESGFNASIKGGDFAKSSKNYPHGTGSVGFSQMTEDNRKKYGLSAADATDPEKSARAMAMMMSDLEKKTGSHDAALGAYNAGLGGSAANKAKYVALVHSRGGSGGLSMPSTSYASKGPTSVTLSNDTIFRDQLRVLQLIAVALTKNPTTDINKGVRDQAMGRG